MLSNEKLKKQCIDLEKAPPRRRLQAPENGGGGGTEEDERGRGGWRKEEERTRGEAAQESPELQPREATMYRAVIARANYLSQDRSDIRYAVKELSRSMSKPTERDWERLKRLGRYLAGQPRLVSRYEEQDHTKYIDVWVDTDFAGCRKTRKSTSGGMAMMGGHIIKH